MAQQKKFFYGWIIAVVCGFLYLVSSGSVLGAAQLANPVMMMETGMSPTMMGFGFTVYVLFQSFGATFAGFMISKFGSKATMVVGAVIMAACALVMSMVNVGAIGYLVVFGVLLSTGSALLGQVAQQSTVGVWFTRYRGRAMTITMTIGRIGSFTTPLIAGAFIAMGGWSYGYLVLVVYGILGAIVALIFIKNRPEDIGALPDGEVFEDDATASVAKPEKPSRVYKNAESPSLKEAMRKPAFYLIILTLSAGFYSYSNTIGCAVSHFTVQGFDPTMITLGVSLMGVCMFIGVALFGAVSDFVEPLRLMSILAIIAGLGILAAAFIQDSWIVFVYYAVIGFSFGGVSNLTPTSIANYWGRGNFSKILGTSMMIGGIATAWGGTIGNAIFEATGAYTNAFILAAAVCIVCAICGFIIRIPKTSK